VASLNGSTGSVYGAIAGAAAVAAVLLMGVYADIDRHERQFERAEQSVAAQMATANNERIENAGRIRALEAAIVEIETQFRALSTVHNLERQRDADITDLLQQCPECKVPQRIYYPPAPGPSGPAAASGGMK